MTWEWLALAGLALVALVSVVALARLRRRTAQELANARVEAAGLRERLDRLEQERIVQRTPVLEEQEYRISRVGEPTEEPAELERAVFADHLLRESVIRVGSLAHGVRRALGAETRHRVRFEMKREVKRARKQRKAEQRLAHREWQARQREDLPDDDLRESA